MLAVSQAFGLVPILPLAVASEDFLFRRGSPGSLARSRASSRASRSLALYRGLALGRMGVVAPIAACDAVIPVFFGLVTGERLAPVESLGIGLALVGVVLVSRPGSAEADKGPSRPLAKGVGLALAAALCFGLFVVTLDGASEGGALWAVVFSRVTSVGLLSIAMLAAIAPRPSTRLFIASKGVGLRLFLKKPAQPPSLRVGRQDRVPLVAIGALDVGANALFAVATTAGLLSEVGVLGSLYPVMTILLARVVLRERLDALQRVGSVGALAGAALIGAG